MSIIVYNDNYIDESFCFPVENIKNVQHYDLFKFDTGIENENSGCAIKFDDRPYVLKNDGSGLRIWKLDHSLSHTLIHNFGSDKNWQSAYMYKLEDDVVVLYCDDTEIGYYVWNGQSASSEITTSVGETTKICDVKYYRNKIYFSTDKKLGYFTVGGQIQTIYNYDLFNSYIYEFNNNIYVLCSGDQSVHRIDQQDNYSLVHRFNDTILCHCQGSCIDLEIGGVSYLACGLPHSTGSRVFLLDENEIISNLNFQLPYRMLKSKYNFAIKRKGSNFNILYSSPSSLTHEHVNVSGQKVTCVGNINIESNEYNWSFS